MQEPDSSSFHFSILQYVQKVWDHHSIGFAGVWGPKLWDTLHHPSILDARKNLKKTVLNNKKVDEHLKETKVNSRGIKRKASPTLAPALQPILWWIIAIIIWYEKVIIT